MTYALYAIPLQCSSYRPPLRSAQVDSSRFNRGVTAPVHARQTLPEYINRSVVIGIHGVAATLAGEARLALTALLVDGATVRTGLRGIGGIDLDKRPAAFFEFVGQHIFYAAPAYVEDRSIKATLPRNALIAGAGSHVAGFQILDDNRAVVSANSGGRLVLPIAPNASRFGLELGDNKALVKVAVRALLPTSQDALLFGDEPVDASEVGCLEFGSIGASKGDANAAINTDGGQRASRSLVVAQHTDAREPNSIFHNDTARTSLTEYRASVAEFNKPNLRDVERRPFPISTLKAKVLALHFEGFVSACFPESRKAAAFEKLGERLVQILKRPVLTVGRDSRDQSFSRRS